MEVAPVEVHATYDTPRVALLPLLGFELPLKHSVFPELILDVLFQRYIQGVQNGTQILHTPTPQLLESLNQLPRAEKYQMMFVSPQEPTLSEYEWVVGNRTSTNPFIQQLQKDVNMMTRLRACFRPSIALEKSELEWSHVISLIHAIDQWHTVSSLSSTPPSTVGASTVAPLNKKKPFMLLAIRGKQQNFDIAQVLARLHRMHQDTEKILLLWYEQGMWVSCLWDQHNHTVEVVAPFPVGPFNMEPDRTTMTQGATVTVGDEYGDSVYTKVFSSILRAIQALHVQKTARVLTFHTNTSIVESGHTTSIQRYQNANYHPWWCHYLCLRLGVGMPWDEVLTRYPMAAPQSVDARFSHIFLAPPTTPQHTPPMYVTAQHPYAATELRLAARIFLNYLTHQQSLVAALTPPPLEKDRLEASLTTLATPDAIFNLGLELQQALITKLGIDYHTWMGGNTWFRCIHNVCTDTMTLKMLQDYPQNISLATYYHQKIVDYAKQQKFSQFWSAVKQQVMHRVQPLILFQADVHQCTSQIVNRFSSGMGGSSGGGSSGGSVNSSTTQSTSTTKLADGSWGEYSMMYLECLMRQPETVGIAVYYLRSMYSMLQTPTSAASSTTAPLLPPQLHTEHQPGPHVQVHAIQPGSSYLKLRSYLEQARLMTAQVS